MKGNYGKMLGKLQKMQKEMAEAEEELASEKLEASAGGGAVTVTVSGRQEVLEVKINPESVDPDDVDMLQDLVLAATNEALRQSRDLAAQKMGRFTGGLDLPGLT